jgi:hypothetical protein
MNTKLIIVVVAALIGFCSCFYFGYIHNPVVEEMEEIIKLQTGVDVHNILPKDKPIEDDKK